MPQPEVKQGSHLMFKTPKTSWSALTSFMFVRERFLFGLTTTSPQCFGTVPSAPEVGLLGGDVRLEVTVVVPSVFCDVAGDADIGVWRVAWG